jgi:hypothetical protein
MTYREKNPKFAMARQDQNKVSEQELADYDKPFIYEGH